LGFRVLGLRYTVGFGVSICRLWTPDSRTCDEELGVRSLGFGVKGLGRRFQEIASRV